jgi:hypothetical protein
MFHLFKNHSADNNTLLTHTQENAPPPAEKIALNFHMFSPGIDNVHIDISLSPSFVLLSRQTVRAILLEYGTDNKRVHEKASPNLRTQLNVFTTAYGRLLEAVTHQAKQGQGLDCIRLFQVAVIHFLQFISQQEFEALLKQLRDQVQRGTQGNQHTVQQHERVTRLAHQQSNLLAHSVELLASQVQWVENSPSGALREPLLGGRWPVPEWLLFNPLVLQQERSEEVLCMQHYVLLHQNPEHPFSLNNISARIDALLARLFPHHSSTNTGAEWINWQEMPDYVASLFDINSCQRALAWAHDATELQRLREQLQARQHALENLIRELRQGGLLPFISAAYATPQLYPSFAYALKPYMVFRVLSGDMALDLAVQKIEMQQKLRKHVRSSDVELPVNVLGKAKKDATRLSVSESESLSQRFIRDFVRYRRDIKGAHLLRHAMQRLHLLFDEQEVRLSQSNQMLHTFLQADEHNNESDNRIRGHVMLKADIRGSTTIVSELKKRELNPATHFSLNFFQPINALLSTYGAEKVFIEGDAVILAIFEHMAAPAQWLCVARACGLATSMLHVVEAQNQICRKHHLPLLEIGIGICYNDDAPTFLYDGDDRITISDAIGAADRLSSCSWALRKKFAGQNLPTHVMVFEQPAGQFKGEKGVTTLRYNLNGIELGDSAFAKLCGEITLNPLHIKFKHDPDTVRFFSGDYPDTQGEMKRLLIRQGQVRLWNPNANDYIPTDKVYYEVMNPRLLQRLQN